MKKDTNERVTCMPPVLGAPYGRKPTAPLARATTAAPKDFLAAMRLLPPLRKTKSA